MGRNVFISYKYGDNNVRQFLDSDHETSTRDYVNVIEDILEETEFYYSNAEEDGEDLNGLPRQLIKSILSDKIFHTSITICLISPNMFKHIKEIDQWVPWEISYSLRNKKRSDGNSNMNAILAVVLPDCHSKYNYAMYRYSARGIAIRKKAFFDIILKNMFNRKGFNTFYDHFGNPIHYPSNSYVALVTWDQFRNNPEKCLEMAVKNRGIWTQFDIIKTINPRRIS